MPDDFYKLNTEYFECACYSSDHVLRWVYDNEYNEIYLEMQLVTSVNIFVRILRALKYIFGYKCRYGHWDEFILRKEDAPRMIELLKKLN